MPDPIADPGSLDRLIHEPARLTLMTALASCRRADFMFLQRLTGLTKGNLSSHLAKLEQAGLVRIEKRFVGRKPNTRLGLTPRGRRAIAEHWKRLEELRRRSRDLEGDDAEGVDAGGAGEDGAPVRNGAGGAIEPAKQSEDSTPERRE